jgi:hypothetical protein
LNQRSSLESHKLDLMTEIGNLHLRQSRLERENLELREQLRAAEITSLKFSVLPQTKPTSGENGLGDLSFDNLGLSDVLQSSENASHASATPSRSSGTPPRPPLNNLNKGAPTSSAAGSGSPRFRGDQHQFLSLPRPGRDPGLKSADSTDASSSAADRSASLSSRPPTGAAQQKTANSSSSGGQTGTSTSGSSDADWPPKDLPVRRLTTPTLDRSRDRIVHSSSPGPSSEIVGLNAKPKQKGLKNFLLRCRSRA